MKSPYSLIPEAHQAAPKSTIYSPHQLHINAIHIHESALTDTLLHEGLDVHQSKIHGLGLFAVKDFIRHDLIWHEKLKKELRL